MRDKEYQVSVDFLKRFFGEALHSTDCGKVELRACPNERSGGAASVFSSDEDQWRRFCEKRDVEGAGVYFGLCTRGDLVNDKGEISGGKDNVQECFALWVDIDCAKQKIPGAAAIDALNFLPHPPTIIVNSGGGLHAYWLLEQAVDVSGGDYAAVEAALRQLALVLAGDTSVAEVARILRLPGTLNSKDATRALNDGAPILCEVLSDSGRVHDLEQLSEWLAGQRPVLHAAAREAARPVQEDDPFVAYAREAGFNPAIEIDDELAAMAHGATGNRSIHATQLRVSASMIARGYEDDEIVDRILRATEAAAPGDAKWNWGREESAIRGMIRTGRQKGYEKAKKPAPSAKSEPIPPAVPLATSGNNALAVVHDMAEERQKREKPEPEESSSRDPLVIVGKAVIGVWAERYGPIMHTGGTTYAYNAGIWEEWSDKLDQRLRATLQEACERLKFAPKTNTLNAAYRYIMERPELHRDVVRFDVHALVVAEDACLDLSTRSIVPHSPDHLATFKVAAKLDGVPTYAEWSLFLDNAFADAPEAEEIVKALQEWFGAALVAAKPRPLRKGLLIHGPSRTGKTQIAQVLRGMLGTRHTSGAKMRDLEGRFGMEPFIGKRGWIADDAVGEGEFLDAETYKVVVTGEPVSVQRKGGKNLETRFGFPVALTANSLPRVKDQSDAVFNRSLILRMTKVRDEAAPEPAGYESIAEKIITEELTGVLWWAIEGWKRLSARGYYAPPAAMLQANRDFQDDNNPVGAWLKQCVELDASTMISRIDLAAAFNGWRTLEHDDDKPWRNNTITRRITAILPGHKTYKQHGERMLTGVRLNEDGLFAWQRAKDTAGFEKKITFSNEKEDVNRFYENPELPPPQSAPLADNRPRF